MEQNHTSDIRTLHMGDTLSLSGSMSCLGNEITLLDDISWKNLVEAPMQIGFLLIVLCTEGEVTFTLGGREQHMEAGDLFISFGEQIIQEEHADRNFHAKAFLMTRQFAQNCIVGLNMMWPYLLYLMKNPVLKMDSEEREWLENCYHLIRRRLSQMSGRYTREATVSLVRAFYFEICNLLDARVQPDQSGVQNRAYAIFDQFIRLLSQHFKQERSVEWYSNEMCLTPKHLSEVVKQVSGKTAGQWITTMVIIEIKNLLKHTTLSIKEIAQDMNFPNQSFLGKYFKNVEGISPSDFRKGDNGKDF
uniref:helix-turn-helix domain-containing protein n=1 Tax=Alloprevotella sp. TaxID=1872471 RepID=UPI0015A9B0B8